MFFSDTAKGEMARKTYFQHIADNFFNPLKNAESMKLYEIRLPSKQIVGLIDNCIDRFSPADLRSGQEQLKKSSYSFTAEKFSPAVLVEGAVCTDKYDLKPDFDNFDRLTRNFRLGVSPRNYDIASLLYIKEYGYASHISTDYFHPFSYEAEFKKIAEKMAECMQARHNSPLSEHDFGFHELVKQSKDLAKDFLKADFYISDGKFQIGRIAQDKLEEQQRQVNHVPSMPVNNKKKVLSIP